MRVSLHFRLSLFIFRVFLLYFYRFKVKIYRTKLHAVLARTEARQLSKKTFLQEKRATIKRANKWMMLGHPTCFDRDAYIRFPHRYPTRPHSVVSSGFQQTASFMRNVQNRTYICSMRHASRVVSIITGPYSRLSRNVGV